VAGRVIAVKKYVVRLSAEERERLEALVCARRTLKNVLKPHRNRQWVIPPDANAGFVAAMEDVLETYQKPRDPDRPLVCLDETSKQLIVETRAPIPARPGRAVRYDYEYEYERNGVANIFMVFAPLEGWRRVKVTDRHAAPDYAQVLKELSDVHFPDAEQIRLVQDNLSTHSPASLYAAFPPEAGRLAKRFEWHYTPKHGSWLDMAESELDVLSSQCLSRRIPDTPTRGRRVAGLSQQASCKGQLAITTDDARVKLKRLYPSF
jgi:DDE superfamily endonuclease